MKVEIELTENVIEMLEEYREMRIDHFERTLLSASGFGLERVYREKVEFYKKATHEYLANEYLRYQAHFEHKKTDDTGMSIG